MIYQILLSYLFGTFVDVKILSWNVYLRLFLFGWYGTGFGSSITFVSNTSYLNIRGHGYQLSAPALLLQLSL